MNQFSEADFSSAQTEVCIAAGQEFRWGEEKEGEYILYPEVLHGRKSGGFLD